GCLGEMKLSLFPPSFQVSDPVIAEDKAFDTGRPFATAERLAVSIKFWPLLRKEVDVKSLRLDRPHIELVRNAQGEWNFATLGQEGAAAPRPAPPIKGGKQNAHSQKAEQSAKPNTASQPAATEETGE